MKEIVGFDDFRQRPITESTKPLWKRVKNSHGSDFPEGTMTRVVTKEEAEKVVSKLKVEPAGGGEYEEQSDGAGISVHIGDEGCDITANGAWIHKVNKALDESINETVILKPSREKFDITTSAKSIAGRIADLIGRMGTMSYEAIRDEFTMILRDENTHASDQTRRKWLEIASTSRGKVPLMKSITNLYLKAAQLGVEPQ